MLVRDKVKLFNDLRDMIVYLPDDYYKTDKQYPVLYIMDGQNAFIDEEAYAKKSWGFVDYVKEHHLDIIMVAIYCSPIPYGRECEYGPWLIDEDLSYHETGMENFIIGGLGDEFVRWMISDLKPMIDHRYRTKVDDTAIVGSSMGGVIAAYASLAYPQVFSKCAALSTAFWFYENEFAKLISETNLEAIQCFYFDIGSDEGCGEDEVDQWYKNSNARILYQLQPKIENLHFCYVGGASHNEWAWAKRLGNFMKLFYEVD